LLAVLQLSTDPGQIDDIVSILGGLVQRDENKSGAGAEGSGPKLGDKLAKWLTIEGDKAANNPKAYVHFHWLTVTLIRVLMTRSTPAGLVSYIFLDLTLTQTLAHARQSFDKTSTFTDLFNTLSLLLDAIEARAADSSSAGPSAKTHRLLHKVGVRVWRMMRDIRESLPVMLDTLTRSTSPRSAILLKHVVGVCLRLKSSPKRPLKGRELLEEWKDKIVGYYCTSILGSKTVLPKHSSEALNEFLTEFMDIDILSSKMMPTAEKMLLRSPEVALDREYISGRSIHYDHTG
jgi:hypothetical protein